MGVDGEKEGIFGKKFHSEISHKMSGWNRIYITENRRKINFQSQEILLKLRLSFHMSTRH